MDSYIGEIRMFAGNYAPQNWAFCHGHLLSISDYAALYSLIGTTYGGDGITSFALPDMRGRIPVGQGTGPGLYPKICGQSFGTEAVTLSLEQMPNHTHTQQASLNNASSLNPTGNVIATTPVNFYENTTTNFKYLNEQSVSTEGGNLSHNNMAPSFCINFIICLVGLYPQRP